MRTEKDKEYADLLRQIADILEGGDVIEDFENEPYYVGVLVSITSIVLGELRTLHDAEEFMRQLTLGEFAKEGEE